MTVPEPKPAEKESVPKKSERTSILSKDLTTEQLSWLTADDIPDEAKDFDHEFPKKP